MRVEGIRSFFTALALASVLGVPRAHADEADLERARKIVSGSCFLCHGQQGEAGTDLFPRLAAQNAGYIARQLADFQTGQRPSSAMRPFVASLTAEDFRALGLYFSRQKSARQQPTDPRLAARGMLVYTRGGAATEVAACIGCHGERGEGTENLPRLAGQVAGYLAAQMRAFASRARPSQGDVMHTIAAKMTDEEIAAVAEYLSGLE